MTLARLTLARACAWALLIAGWIGIGSIALPLAPSYTGGFALVALWLLALGLAATVATRGDLQPRPRALALCASAAATATGLQLAVRGGGLPALLLALTGLAALTALASGVVRSLRLLHPATPRPPTAAAACGALAAAIVLGDPANLTALATRLSAAAAVIALALMLLQPTARHAPPAPACRAGLFDCSLPAWPTGAWRDSLQWPTLLAGLAMLPMMAALPLMAAWCRAQGIPPQAMVLVHLAAMFVPAFALSAFIARWSARTLSIACACLLVCGAALVAWAPAPMDWLGLAVAHGMAWGLAWAGQLWAPARRAQQGSSPLRAAAGYAVLTLAFGLVVDEAGPRGVAAVHATLGVAAALAWLWRGAAAWRSRGTAAQRPPSPATPPTTHGGSQ
jgi:hypothetical protein